MDPRFQAQLDARQQAEHLHAYMKDLIGWQKEVKQKEKAIRKGANSSLPPVRGKAGAVQLSAAAAAPTESSSKPSRHPASHTYDHYRDKWDNFDVDAALASDDDSEAVGVGIQKACSRPVDIPAANARVSQEEVQRNCSNQVQATEETDRQAHTVRGPQAQVAEAEMRKAEGNRLFKMGLYAKASECYTSSLKKHPTCLAFANRAMARLKLKEFTEAEADCSEALQLDGTYVKAYHRRASARNKLGDFQGAIDDLESVLRWEPGNKAAAAELQDCISKLLDQEGLVWQDKKERIPVYKETSQAAPAAEAAAQSSGLKQCTAHNVPTPASATLRTQEEQATPIEDGQVLLRASGSRRLKSSSIASCAAQEDLDQVEDGMQELEAGFSPGRAAAAGRWSVAGIGDPCAPPLPDPVDQSEIQSRLSPATHLAQQQAMELVYPADQSFPARLVSQPMKAALVAEEPPALALVQTVPENCSQQPAPVAHEIGSEQQAQQLTALRDSPAASPVLPMVQPKPPGSAAIKAPRNGLEFERGWKSCKGNDVRQSEYLQLIAPLKLPAILKQGLTPALLTSVMLTLLGPTMEQSAPHAVAMMEIVPNIPRFDMNLMSVPAKEKARVAEAWDQAAAALKIYQQTSAELVHRLEKVRERYKL